MKKMTIYDKLALDLFHTDEENAHIQINKACKDEAEIRKVVLACPAGCYKYIDGEVQFSHLGCLECGTCRVLSMGKLIEDWHYPEGSFGVSYREG